jgi:hypothetical protein
MQSSQGIQTTGSTLPQYAPGDIAFTSKEKAQYVELVNDQLRAVQICDPRMFSVFASALQQLLNPTATPPPSDEKISRCVEDLTEMLEHPEMYAKAEHHKEFRSIIRDRVAAKIKELDLLVKDEKAGQTYIELQQKSRKEAQDSLETMKAAHEPAQGSEGHVVSEEENVRQQAVFWRRQEEEAAEFRSDSRGEHWQFEDHLHIFGGTDDPLFTSTADLEQRAVMMTTILSSSIREEENGHPAPDRSTRDLSTEISALAAEALGRLTTVLQHRQRLIQS